MSSQVVLSEYLTLTNPLSIPWSFVGLELTVIGCGLMTFVHALRARRAGEPERLFAWTCIFVYGLLMELLSYNFVDNFTHGQFTVMLYHQKLPLYISLLYPVFIYTSLVTVQRLALPRWAEPLAVGFTIVMLDMPFDILGPMCQWWSWSAIDPNLAYRWHGVPVTSYYWHCAFGAILVAVVSALRARVRRSPVFGLWMTAPAAVVTIVLGFAAFAPFHGLKALGVADGTVVLGLLLASAALLFVRRRRLAAVHTPDRTIVGIVAMYYGLHVAVLAGIVMQELGDATVELLAAAAAASSSMVVGALIQVSAQRRTAPQERNETQQAFRGRDVGHDDDQHEHEQAAPKRAYP